MTTAEHRIHALAQRLWDFHTAPHHEPAPGHDLLLVLGSHDLRVAEHAARLYAGGIAPLLVFSGDRGRRTAGDHTGGRWPESEAHTFARAARRAADIPPAALLLETRATNTGENFALARALVEQRGRRVERAVVAAKPYMGRRALATAAVHWPGPDWTFTAFGGGYRGYTGPEHTAGELVHFLVGDTQRLAVYARRGWSAPVAVPDDVWAAYDALVAAGYTGHLIPGEPARTAALR